MFYVTYNNISAISWWSVFWRRKPEYPAKTIDLPQVTDKLYLIMLYRIHIGIEKHNNICTKYKTVYIYIFSSK